MNLRGQLPAEVPRILHAGLKSHSAVGKVHMRSVASNQHASVTISLRLTSCVRSPCHPTWLAHRELGADDSKESLLEFAHSHRHVAINLSLIPLDPRAT